MPKNNGVHKWSLNNSSAQGHTSLGRHSLECGLNFHVTKDLHQTTFASSESRSLERLPWSFHNLIELQMKYNHNRDVKCIIPSNELLQLQMLETIQIYSCYYVEEVFEAMEGRNSVVEIQNLTKMELGHLSSLEYIWKSNHHHHHQTVLKFPNLTKLSIYGCESLQYIFTNSMVGSIQQLQDLHIKNCNNMEVIVKGEETEFESDAKVKELPCLNSLKLEFLLRLEGFWLGKDDFSWPSLDTLVIVRCPEIKVFTNGHVATPALDVIDTGFGRCYIRDDDNINSFIKNKLHEGFQF